MPSHLTSAIMPTVTRAKLANCQDRTVPKPKRFLTTH